MICKLSICVCYYCAQLCYTIQHGIQNSSDSLLSYTPDHHHCSDAASHVARNFKGGVRVLSRHLFGGKYTAQAPTTYHYPKLEQWAWITPWGNYEVQSSPEATAFINAKLKC